MADELRVLRPGDEAAVLGFLERFLDSSLFPISNIERGGLEDHGLPAQGTYVAHLSDGVITAVAGHGWNGSLQLQGDLGIERAAKRAVYETKRAVRAVVGPLALVQRVVKALAIEERQIADGKPECLYALELGSLAVPELLARAEVECRFPSEAEVQRTLVPWRVEYMVEASGVRRTPELEADVRRGMAKLHLAENTWVLVRGGELVAVTSFNASTHRVVQVGGVYTPPVFRGRGYARAAVAGSLRAARARGATRSVLFVARDNRAARTAYEALGYRPIGDFGVVILH